jgi:hypothetical protein
MPSRCSAATLTPCHRLLTGYMHQRTTGLVVAVLPLATGATPYAGRDR